MNPIQPPGACDSECVERQRIDRMLRLWRTNDISPGDNNPVSSEQTATIPPSTDPIIINLWEKYNIYSSKTLNLATKKSYRNALLKEQKTISQLNEDNSASAITNDRKVVYEELARERLFTIGNTLRTVYVVVLVLYLYYGPFIKNDWKTANGWIIPVILIIFPFIINYLVIALRLVYNKILWLISNKIYRNVYV